MTDMQSLTAVQKNWGQSQLNLALIGVGRCSLHRAGICPRLGTFFFACPKKKAKKGTPTRVVAVRLPRWSLACQASAKTRPLVQGLKQFALGPGYRATCQTNPQRAPSDGECRPNTTSLVALCKMTEKSSTRTRVAGPVDGARWAGAWQVAPYSGSGANCLSPVPRANFCACLPSLSSPGLPRTRGRHLRGRLSLPSFFGEAKKEGRPPGRTPGSVHRASVNLQPAAYLIDSDPNFFEILCASVPLWLHFGANT